MRDMLMVEEIDKLLEERNKAIKDGLYERAIAIEFKLTNAGVFFKDLPEGIRWSYCDFK